MLIRSCIFKLCQVGAHPTRNICLPICENSNQMYFQPSCGEKIHISASAQPITCATTFRKKILALFYYVTWIPMHKHLSIFTPNDFALQCKPKRTRIGLFVLAGFWDWFCTDTMAFLFDTVLALPHLMKLSYFVCTITSKVTFLSNNISQTGLDNIVSIWVRIC